MIVDNTDANHIQFSFSVLNFYFMPTLVSAGVIAGIILGTIFGFLFSIVLPITICFIIGCYTWRSKKSQTRITSLVAAVIYCPVSEYPVEHYYPAGANFPVGRTSVTINYPVSEHPQLALHGTQISYNPQVDSSSNVLYPKPQVGLNIYQFIINIMITRIIKTFSIKMKEDVGTSKPKKHANKVGRLT